MKVVNVNSSEVISGNDACASASASGNSGAGGTRRGIYCIFACYRPYTLCFACTTTVDEFYKHAKDLSHRIEVKGAG